MNEKFKCAIDRKDYLSVDNKFTATVNGNYELGFKIVNDETECIAVLSKKDVKKLRKLLKNALEELK